MKSGIHTHHCPVCKADKYCPVIPYCRRPEESICVDCADKTD